MYGVESILSKTLKANSEVKDCLDGCWATTGPSMVVTTEPFWKSVKELAQRGVRLRYITDITSDNISYCKIMIENGTQIRHLPEIKSNFGIADRTEYMATVIMEEKKPLWQAIVSNAKTFVEGQQSVFDMLWDKALPAERRIREIEEGLRPDFIETIRDPVEIQRLSLDLIKSAKEEVLVLSSTSNSFLRQERIGLLKLLRDIASEGAVKVRILVHLNNEIRGLVDSLISPNNFSVRGLQQSLQSRLTTLIVDGKFSLEVEVKDDTKDNSYDAVGLATYSNSESTVWTHASIFETLWRQAQISDAQKIEQKI